MLTNDEIQYCRDHSSGNTPFMRDKAFARVIIAAYQDKLRQGVEMPEPSVLHDGAYCFRLHQLQQYGDARDQAGYLRGLEECLEICNRLTDKNMHSADCAAAIDKLKGGE